MTFSDMLNQTAVYWPTPTKDGWGGFSYGTAVEINCRWEWRQKLFIDFEGNEILSNAEIWIDQEVDIQGFLYLGTLSDLPSSHDDPTAIDGAWMVKNYEDIPGVDAGEYLKKAMI